MTIGIVSFPINSMVIFHRFLYVYQAGYPGYPIIVQINPPSGRVESPLGSRDLKSPDQERQTDGGHGRNGLGKGRLGSARNSPWEVLGSPPISVGLYCLYHIPSISGFYIGKWLIPSYAIIIFHHHIPSSYSIYKWLLYW